ncbi:MAG TPA: AAA family ATPase, partial [Candidatus Merdibacter merdigallinarum]|nr:AAA family ATPase [Candidatus Merdibacter merdigallinarum]
MNHELLKSVIFDQHAAIQAARITLRGYTFEKNANYVLVGLRRAGKSTLLFDIARKLVTQGTEWNQIIYINFEDERLAEFTAADFN